MRMFTVSDIAERIGRPGHDKAALIERGERASIVVRAWNAKRHNLPLTVVRGFVERHDGTISLPEIM